jgi:hypothetical protein
VKVRKPRSRQREETKINDCGRVTESGVVPARVFDKTTGRDNPADM